MIAAGEDLAGRWRALRAERPGVRAREAADALGVSEAELVATTVGDTAIALDGDMAALVHGLPAVGRCMALTRNPHAVSEVRGRYGGVELGAHAGQIVGDGIDLRVFLDHWRYAFAVDEPRRSLQIFDAAGTAVHKVYLEPEGDPAAWDALVAARAAKAVRAMTVRVEPAPAPPPPCPDDEVDVGALRREWDLLTDTHEFFTLLRRHRLARTQALRLAGAERARRTTGDALHRVLVAAAASGTRALIFVGNRGCLQVYSGSVARILRTGPWLNVLDPAFNLHLREDAIAESWVVSKPTRTGAVRSLEIYDAAGETIAMIFRKRDDRERAEDPAWGELLDRLPEVAA